MQTLNDNLDPRDEPDAPAVHEPANRSTPETAILTQYQNVSEGLEDAHGDVEIALGRVKWLKAEKARLYKLASVIDPSLKNTRPKS